jgi:hypothetical protein
MPWSRLGVRARWAAAVSCAVWCGAMSISAQADGPVMKSLRNKAAGSSHGTGDVEDRLYSLLEQTQGGTSAPSARRAALQELSLTGLTADAQAKAKRLIDGLGLFRRMPTLSFAVEPAVYRHLLQNPDLAVATWRAMEISKFRLVSQQPGVYTADAGDGSTGTVELWRSTPEETLIYCDGAFKSPVLPRPIQARSLMRLKTQFRDTPEGSRVEHSADVFVEFPSQSVETVAKVIAPVSYPIADRNFKQLSLYVHLMSQAMTQQPAWVVALSDRLDCSAEQRLGLQELAISVHAQRQKAVPMSEVSVPEALQPFRLPTAATTSSTTRAQAGPVAQSAVRTSADQTAHRQPQAQAQSQTTMTPR